MSLFPPKKAVRTYSRQKKRSLEDDDPPLKRRRVSSNKTSSILEATSATQASSVDDEFFTRDSSIPPVSSPREQPPLFSDEPPQSTPPSSPTQASSPPPLPTKRHPLSLLKRKAAHPSLYKTPLSERSHNAQSTTVPPPKKKRLVQMQLDLVGEVRKGCKVCGMEYIPSNSEDAAMHRKFHTMSVGGIDFTKVFVERLRQNQVWSGSDGSFIAVIARRDALALRNKATDVLKVVTTELGAVPILEAELWSRTCAPSWVSGGEKTHSAAKGHVDSPASDRFKVYLYVRGQKCLGACLAERIREGFTVLRLEQEAATAEAGGRIPMAQSSSVSVSDKPDPVMLGISRIWTSNEHRKRGIATKLLESARSDFLYGMTIEKAEVAFSQPTESGGNLARKWFGSQAGWHVYMD